MYYWNQTRNTNYPLLSKNENTIFEDYLTCHEDNYSREKKNITLPHTSQTISYKVIHNIAHGTHDFFLYSTYIKLL